MKARKSITYSMAKPSVYNMSVRRAVNLLYLSITACLSDVGNFLRCCNANEIN